ncbi:MAG: sugar phosphate permease [Enterobacterales bacterium]
MNKDTNSKSWLVIFSLIFAGEMIFSLPFHVARFFRPTFLESFGLSNANLGDTFAVYGITAMICYFPGGLIADSFSARKLLTSSLLATAIGGIYFAQIPEGVGLSILFGYWGITTILLFWSGMIKATRDWGGNDAQGRAFGLLDGGRGLVAALMSSIAVLIFSNYIGANPESASAGDKIESMKAVIYFYSIITTCAAIILWKCIPESESTPQTKVSPLKEGIIGTISSSNIWLQAGIIICAYCAYKGADNYGLYAVQVLSMNHVDAASFTSIAAYLRPVGAVLAGLIADRFSASRTIQVNFLLLGILYGMLSVSWEASMLYNLAMFNLITSYLAVFALRGVYFALVEESKVNASLTGTAVGFISFIGYTPDIFFASVSGRILDANEGIKGFENYFLFMMIIAMTGLIIAVALNHKNRALIKA